MKLLLDTHTFIWWDNTPERLSPTALAVCTNPANELIVSVVSLWEIQIKNQLGKLTLRLPLNSIVKSQQVNNGITILPVMAEHIFALNGLPLIHKDPFDRLLIAQAISDGSTIVGADAIFTSYPVPVLW